MKFLFKEHEGIDYNQYKFPYCVYGLKEQKDTYQEIYERGFLPFTNNLKEQNEVYYLARSLRIDLKEHHFKSRQKNILNKFAKCYQDEHILFQKREKKEMIDNQHFLKWCITNAKNGFLKEERLAYILSRPYLIHILSITYHQETLAHLFIVEENKAFVHVWYSFYDLSVGRNDFGKWIFLKTIAWAKQQGYTKFYIGTCYSKNAFYKLSLSPATSFFDGSNWVPKITELKKKLLTEAK